MMQLLIHDAVVFERDDCYTLTDIQARIELACLFRVYKKQKWAQGLPTHTLLTRLVEKIAQ